MSKLPDFQGLFKFLFLDFWTSGDISGKNRATGDSLLPIAQLSDFDCFAYLVAEEEEYSGNCDYSDFFLQIS